ncbi:zinc finger protein 335-like isoform X1 [Conger conger]|uniref:zinc finger protein 335-like isoform X1 n=1 Tax=Conger conger TaxID=82655 RepID=UPI002A59CBC0|nr:zinc finger protein 335-like isoform X1 [Conger conger]
MSNEILFRTQLASIMEVLANAAVEEICKLVDDGYTVLHLQMSEYQKENETLKMRLHLMELNCAQRERPPERYADGAVALREKRRATAKDGPTVSGKRLHGSPGDVCLQVLHTDVGEDNTGATFGLKQVETAEAENDGSGSILIKEEVPVEHSDPPAALQIPVQGALGLRVSSAESSEEPPELRGTGHGTGVWETAEAENDGSGSILIKEEVPVEHSDPPAALQIPVQGALGLRVSSAESSEEPPELRGTGHGTGVWEVSGLEAVLRLQAGNMAAQRLGNAGSECRAGMGTLGARGSQSAVVYETAGHSQTLTEDKDQSRPFHGGDSERYPAVPRELAGARVRPPPSDSPDLVPDVVIIDSVKEEAVTLLSQWDKEPTVPVRADSQHGRRRDDRETELEPRPDPVNPSSLSRDWSTSGEIASNPDAGSLKGRNLAVSGNFAAGCNNSATEKRFICRYCGKGFSRQDTQKTHQRVHTGEKPYRCAQCGKRFSDSSNHRRHQSVHSRERPFSCTQCQRSFSHHYQLKVHQRVHTGDQPFNCVHCGRKFGERTFLKLHQQREHAPLYVA